ncbi:MFS transporter [Kiloniella sp. b19]|uniref:MFS transporter n=1 Tax=Kiloniella sp. GXU_MW_B19 TaxID=3141326 RepID=UPI0031E49135
MQHSPEGSSQNVLYLGLVSFFTDLASAMINPVVPLFLVIVLQEGVDKVGLILAITSMISYGLRFVCGALSDRFDSSKPLLITGYGLSALTKPLLAFVGGWQGVALVRSAERLGKALRAAPKDRLIGLSGKKGSEGKSFGLHKTFDVAGEFCGLFVLLIVLFALGTSESVFRGVFLAALIPGILAVLILAVFVRDRSSPLKKKPSVRFHLDRELRKPVIVYCGMSLFMFSEAFYVVLANERDFKMTSILMVLILMRAVQLLLSYRVGKLVDKYDSTLLLNTGYGFGLLALIALLDSSAYTLVLAFLLFGISDVVLLNAIRAKISKDAREKGAAFGAFYLLHAICLAAGLALLGYVWEAYGIQAVLIFSISGMGLCFLIQLVVPAGKASRPDVELQE